jgi:hypothetical protein
MPLFTVSADFTGLKEVLTRIADALDRIKPPRQGAEGADTAIAGEAPLMHSMAESSLDYESRLARDDGFASSLGLQSTDAVAVISEMRQSLMEPRFETDNEGNEAEVKGLSYDEAEDVIQKAFSEARLNHAKR